MIIAGTGHRPKYCPCQYNENHPWLLDLKKDLREKLLEKSPDSVISGMAIGFDTWLANAALDLNIKLLCYVPFNDQGKTWPKKAYREYCSILERAHVILYLSNTYTEDCFLKRDRAMIDDCDEVFALLNPECSTGGTYYTVNYANNKNRKITHFWR